MTGSAIADSPSSDVESFTAAAQAALATVSHRFLKIEALQDYREPGDPADEAYRSGDLARAKDELRKRIAAQAPLYALLHDRGVILRRLRIIERPLSAYVLFECAAYEVAAAHGEEIRIVERSRLPSALADDPHLRDWVLIDDMLLVHEYDASGIIRGGTVISAPTAVAAAANLWEHVAAWSIPLQEFLARELPTDH